VKDNDSNPNTWSGLPEDLQDKILRKAGLRFVYERPHMDRQVPLELRPPLLDIDRGNPWADTKQRLVIERSRHAIEGHGPRDVLTVSFSDCVNKDWYGFDRNKDRHGYLGYDEDAVCKAMDFKRTWTNVTKIQLNFNDIMYRQNFWDIVLTRQGADGHEEVVHVPHLQIYQRVNEEEFARRLEEELHLTRRTVANGDEFTVA